MTSESSRWERNLNEAFTGHISATRGSGEKYKQDGSSWGSFFKDYKTLRPYWIYIFNFCIIVVKAHYMRHSLSSLLSRHTSSSCLSSRVETWQVQHLPLLSKFPQLLALTIFPAPISQDSLRKQQGKKGCNYIVISKTQRSIKNISNSKTKYIYFTVIVLQCTSMESACKTLPVCAHRLKVRWVSTPFSSPWQFRGCVNPTTADSSCMCTHNIHLFTCVSVKSLVH